MNWIASFVTLFVLATSQIPFPFFGNFATINPALETPSLIRLPPRLRNQSPYYRYKSTAIVSIGADQPTDVSA